MRSRPRHRLAGPVVDRTYRDRREAGAALAALLGCHAGSTDVVVLGLARGGMPVAAEVAGRLGTPLDVLVVRKLGVPWAPEVAFGAIGPDEVVVFTAFADRLSADEIDTAVATERAELARQDAQYHADHPATDLSGRTAVLIDDGLATGATARAAVEVARRRGHRARRAGRRTGRGRRPGSDRGRAGLPVPAGQLRRRRPVLPGLSADLRRRGARPAELIRRYRRGCRRASSTAP
jgi:pyrimidine operon attenuation protein/uracil phosphoribosyltransferase